MAANADWIKMRSDLYRNPKVILMASELMRPGPLASYVNQNCQCDMAVTRNVMRNATVGALVSVWGVMRHRGVRRDDDLFVSGVGIAVVDDIADMPGFSEVMVEAEWLVEVDDGLVFPRFFADHNVDPAQKNRDRQRKFREKKRKAETNVTDNVTVTLRNAQSKRESREEIEKDKNPSIKSPFRKPSIEQLRAYCEERSNGINPQAFLDHYESNGWKVGKNPMKDWKATVRKWEQNQQKGLFTNGRTTSNRVGPGQRFQD